MNYRDPLFSVIVFFLLIFFAIVFALAFEKVREYFRQKEIEDLIKNFEYISTKDLENPINAMILLAKAYEKEGNYEKALKIFLLIEKKKPSNEILLNIANLYFKAGFLQKASEIVYKVLKTIPRNIDALKLLILINEKLDNIKETIDILGIFEELEITLPKEKAYALIRLFLKNRCNIEDFCIGIKTFDDIYKNYPFTKREYVEYLFKTDPKKAYEILDVYEHLDLYYNRDDIPDNEKFCNILAAKKKKTCSKKAPFEIECMKYLPKNLAELEFEYYCTNCKKTFPLYSTRCPKCHELFSLRLLFKLSNGKKVENMEF